MDFATLILWIVIGIDSSIIIALIWWGIYASWFDDRLRVVIVDSKNNITIQKIKHKEDNRFTHNKGEYMIDKEAIYRRFVKIPYAFYYINNPNPIKFEKQKSKIIYTAQEVHKLLDTNVTLNLIKSPVQVKKIVIGTVIIIGILALVGVILQVTGVIDWQTFMLQTG